MKKIISLIIAVFLLYACASDDGLECIPSISIDREYLIMNIHELEINGAYVFPGGIKGIVIKRTTFGNPEFRAYDLQAPHLCPYYEYSTLKLDPDFSTLSGEDGSQFSLYDGSPVANSNRPLIEYWVVVEGKNNIYVGGRK